MNESRQPAGTPIGGQFAASARHEVVVTLADDPPVSLAEAMSDQTHLRIGEDEFDADYGFDYVIIQDDGAGGFVAYPTVEEDMVDGLAIYMTKGRPHVDFAQAREAANAWLIENGETHVNGHLEQAYGATNDEARDWDMLQVVSCEAPLDADAMTSDVLEQCDITHARNMGEDFVSGAFYDAVLEKAAMARPANSVGHISTARRDAMVRAEIDSILAEAPAEEPSEVLAVRGFVDGLRDRLEASGVRGRSTSQSFGDIAAIGYQDLPVKDADGYTKPFGAAGAIDVTTGDEHRSFDFGVSGNEDNYETFEAAREAAVAYLADGQY